MLLNTIDFSRFLLLKFKCNAAHFNSGTFTTNKLRSVVTFCLASEDFQLPTVQRILLGICGLSKVGALTFINDTLHYLQLQLALGLICIVASMALCTGQPTSSNRQNLLPCPKEKSPMETITIRTSLIEIYPLTYLFGIIEIIFVIPKIYLEILIFEISLVILTG